jgi:hypothetical protein
MVSLAAVVVCVAIGGVSIHSDHNIRVCCRVGGMTNGYVALMIAERRARRLQGQQQREAKEAQYNTRPCYDTYMAL